MHKDEEKLLEWMRTHRGKATIIINEDGTQVDYWLRGWYPNDREFGWHVNGHHIPEKAEMVGALLFLTEYLDGAYDKLVLGPRP